jgi:hypothetical protein
MGVKLAIPKQRLKPQFIGRRLTARLKAAPLQGKPAIQSKKANPDPLGGQRFASPARWGARWIASFV